MFVILIVIVNYDCNRTCAKNQIIFQTGLSIAMTVAIVPGVFDDYIQSIVHECHSTVSKLTSDFSVYYIKGHLYPRLIDRIEQDPSTYIFLFTSDFDHWCPQDLEPAEAHSSHSELVYTWLSTTKKILIISAGVGVKNSTLHRENVCFLHFGNCHYQMLQYPDLEPVRHKHSVDYHWISLSNRSRPQRSLAAMVLLAHDLGICSSKPDEKTGLLRIDATPAQPYDSYLSYLKGTTSVETWIHPSQHRHDMLTRGFEYFKTGKNGGQNHRHEIYENGQITDNATNFQQQLRKLYSQSYLEIVNETIYFSDVYFATEKFLNSVYGFNLPLLVAPQGQVQFLRDRGFDLCDHVLDHSYDTLADPIERICVMVEKNLELLQDSTAAHKAWTASQSQLQHNYEYAKSAYYTNLADYYKRQLDHCLIDFCKLKTGTP
jgi:hypothetical protein